MERLPQDTITNILARLHWKKSYRCRCVSKLWCRILSDPNFPKIQFTQLSSHSPDFFLHFKDYQRSNTSKMYYLEDNNKALHKRPYKEFEEGSIIKKFDDKYPFILGSCNGFVCLIKHIPLIKGNAYGFPSHPIYIFNPLTEEQSMLPPFPIPEPYNLEKYQNHDDGVYRLRDRWLCGFGYEDLNKNFKVVLVLIVAVDYKAQIFKNEVQVHTLGSTTWRSKVGIVPDVLHRSVEVASSAVIDGSLHWISVDQSLSASIVSFNLALEEFGYVPTPELQLRSKPYIGYTLGLFEDHLSVVDSSAYSYIDIWVMKKYNVKESWVKQFSIDTTSMCRLDGLFNAAKLVKIRKNGELLILWKAMCLFAYNPTSRKYRVLPLGWSWDNHRYNLEAYPLVGSLISLKSAFGMDCNTKKTTSTKRKR